MLTAASVALVVVLAAVVRGRIAPRRPLAPPATGGRRGFTRLIAALPTARPVRASDGALAAWCDGLARELRSGSSLVQAIVAAPADPRLAEVLDPLVLAVGRLSPVERACDAITPSTPGWALVLEVLRTCARVGGPAAEPLDRVAATLRQRVADADERRAQSAQARASALALTILPVAALVLLVTVAPAIRAATLSVAGLLAVSAGATLNLTGWYWMRRVVERGR